MKRIEFCAATCDHAAQAEILSSMAEAALKAGNTIKSLYGKPHDIKHKGAIDLVTEADVAAEKIILDILQGKFADVAVLAEESAADFSRIPAGPAWIIDPLDGTTNFAHGFPFFGVSIAQAVNGIPQAGVIYLPMQDELFCAAKGCGAWLNNEMIRVSASDELIKSLIATGFPYDVNHALEKVIKSIKEILPKVRDIRRAGAAALDLAYVACGRLDGFWEMNLKPWDTAAGQLLVEEAGGKMSNFSGGEFSSFFPEVVASNGKIHRQLTDILADCF